MLLGIGRVEKLTKVKLKRSGAQLTKALLYSGETHASIWLDGDEFQLSGKERFSHEAAAAEIGFGICLRAYRFSSYKTKEAADKTPSLTAVSSFLFFAEEGGEGVL